MSIVAVLGCGPAGLFAAQAISIHGMKPVIISKKKKSELYGAQYLHRPIPGLSSQLPTGSISTYRVGRPEAYAERVYGLSTIVTSWDRVVPLNDAWDLRRTYDAAWDKFSDDIVDTTIGPDDVSEFSATFDLVISTIPLWAICDKTNKHLFRSQNILVRKDVKFHEVPMVEESPAENWVVYNGTHMYSWYRASYIFGHTSVEARSEPSFQINKLWEPGFKVVDTDCDCHPAVIRAGRMGTWTRGVLTHHAFERTVEAISEQFGIIPCYDHTAKSD
jgi:hypothetical protein